MCHSGKIPNIRYDVAQLAVTDPTGIQLPISVTYQYRTFHEYNSPCMRFINADQGDRFSIWTACPALFFVFVICHYLPIKYRVLYYISIYAISFRRYYGLR